MADIEVKAVYKPLPGGKQQFENLMVRIGEKVFDPIPVKFMRISEMKNFRALLEEAFRLGQETGI